MNWKKRMGFPQRPINWKRQYLVAYIKSVALISAIKIGDYLNAMSNPKIIELLPPIPLGAWLIIIAITIFASAIVSLLFAFSVMLFDLVMEEYVFSNKEVKA